MACQKCSESRDALKRAANALITGNVTQIAPNIKTAATNIAGKIKESDRVKKLLRRA